MTTIDAVRALPAKHDFLAPDNSRIRLLAVGSSGGLAHCVLGAGRTSVAVRHKTVEELWYVLEGEGEVWRACEGQSQIEGVRPGTSFRITPGMAFQFRAAATSLQILIVTMPPWPGPSEAIPIEGLW